MATAIQESIDSSQNQFKPVQDDYYQKYQDQEQGEIQQFGPATRDNYDSNQWGIVPYNEASSSSSTVAAGFNQKSDSSASTPPIPQLRDREKIPLLLPSNDAIYIAPLIMIVHSIPLGRKALLNGGVDVVSDYGFEKNWWTGDKLIGMGNSAPTHNRERLLIETQRLAAFLDGGSCRPVVSIQNLISEAGPKTSRLILKSGSYQNEKPVGRFLQDLVKYWGLSSDFAHVFQSTVVQDDQSPFDDPGTYDGESVQRFTNLIAEVTVAVHQSVYDFVDELMSADGSGPATTFIREISDIINLSIKRDDGNSGTGIEIPAIWYPDRYSEEYFECINVLRQRRLELRKRLSQLNTQRLNVSSTMGKDISKLLNISYEYIKGAYEDSEDKENYNIVEKELLNVKDLYTKRKEAIVDEATYIQQTILKEATFFKGPMNDDDKELLAEFYPKIDSLMEMRPYRLRGIIISPTEFCFLQETGSEEDLDLIDLENNEYEKSNEPKWLKIVTGKPSENYGSGQIDMEEITQQDAINWAKEGSSDYKWQEVVAFYANDYASNKDAHKTALSEGLKRFIEADRRSLEQEIDRLNGDDSESLSVSPAEMDTSAGPSPVHD